MRPADDQAYYTQRARQERARASICEDHSAALIHLQLADEYERRASAGDGRLRIVDGAG